MNNWKKYKIGDLCDITRGGSPRPIQDFISDQGTPWVKISDAHENSRYIKNTREFIKPEGEKNSRVVFPGDFILSNSATPGLPRWMKIRACIHDGWLLLRNFSYNIDEIFLHYKLTTEREAILAQGNGSIFINLKTEILKNHEILIPQISEQKAIASVLSSLDDKIDLLHRQNATLEKMAETLFRQWFVEEAKEEWGAAKLKDVTSIGIGRTPPRKESHWFSENPTDIKWISIKDLGNDGIFISNTSEYLTRDAVHKFNVPIIPRGTVVLSFKMTVGRVAITSEEMLSNEAIAHFKFTEKTPFSKEYLYLFLKNFKYDTLGSTSSIVTAINSAMIKDLEILIPDSKSMQIFNDYSVPLFNKIKSNQTQITTLISLRDTLLPRLMSGEIKVA